VASELGMSILVPESPGVLCAAGVLTKDIQIDLSQTRILRGTSVEIERQVQTIYDELEDRAKATFVRNGLGIDGLVVERTVDARYAGQNFELAVAVPSGAIDGAALDAVRKGFDAVHRRLYGYDQPEKEIELVTFRIKAFLPVEKPKLGRERAAARSGGLVPVGERRTFFESAAGFVACPIYERGDLDAGDAITGPAIIEQMDTTTVIPPGFVARVDELMNLHLGRG
jgi:N-methylhydantoinase A